MTDNNINTSPEKLRELYNLKRKMFRNKSKLSCCNKLFKKLFIKNFQQINKVYDNNKETQLFLDVWGLRWIFPFHPSLSVLKLDGSKEIINYKKYMKLMNNYANLVGIKKIKPIWITHTHADMSVHYD